MQQRIGQWAAPIFMATALAACGGGGDDPGSGTTPSAADCYNPQLNQNGTTAQFDYQVSGGAVGEEHNQVSVSTGAEFHGASSLTRTRALNTFSYTAPILGGTATTDIYTSDNGHQVIQYGTLTEWPDTGEKVEIWYDSPLTDRRFTLALDASDTAATSMRTKTTTSSFETTTRTDLSTKVTYQGQESITVAAGTFTACKFRVESVETIINIGSRTTTSTEWIATTSGVLLKNVFDGATPTTYELKASSRLNGAPLP